MKSPLVILFLIKLLAQKGIFEYKVERFIVGIFMATNFVQLTIMLFSVQQWLVHCKLFPILFLILHVSIAFDIATFFSFGYTYLKENQPATFLASALMLLVDGMLTFKTLMICVNLHIYAGIVNVDKKTLMLLGKHQL